MSDDSAHRLPDRSAKLAPVLRAAAMRAADTYTIDELGIPGFTLMESAGREAARLAAATLAPASHVLVVVGKGNNGGDGLVVARWLADAGYAVSVFLTAAYEKLSPDSSANLSILEKLGQVAITSVGDWTVGDLAAWQGDLIIDALFGTGLESALRAPYDEIVRAINDHAAPTWALDVPSGLSATTGQAFEPCIEASVTVTMGAMKAGMVIGDGPDTCGEVHVADIGIPKNALRTHAAHTGSGFLSSDAWVADLLRERTRSDHKYTTGPTLVVGGSDAFPGAPALAARSAARIGSGYVVAIGPASIRQALQEQLDAIPVASWEGDDARAFESLKVGLDTRWDKARALLIGPGLGRDATISALTWSLLDAFEGPVVLDADALFMVSSQRERTAEASAGRWILTPHAGELVRLDPASDSGSDVNVIERIQRVAREWNCVVLAKGQPSITAHPDGRTIINTTGHPAAGTAGSGDVLAGMVAGLLAQDLAPFEAAAAAIHIGGTAAGRFVERGASQSMVASDLIEVLPEALRHLS